MKVGTLLLRGTIGGFFVGHGAQKLFGVAGGAGIKGTGQFFESLGLRPGTVHATLAGVAETGGGLGLLLGYRTPLASSAVVATMTTAIQRVHGKNGWNTQNGGYEYPAVLIAGAVALAEVGPGALSLDALRGKQSSGVKWGLFALAGGVGGALVNGMVADHFSPSAVEPAPISEPVTVEEAVTESAEELLVIDPLGAEPMVDPEA